MVSDHGPDMDMTAPQLNPALWHFFWSFIIPHIHYFWQSLHGILTWSLAFLTTGCWYRMLLWLLTWLLSCLHLTSYNCWLWCSIELVMICAFTTISSHEASYINLSDVYFPLFDNMHCRYQNLDMNQSYFSTYSRISRKEPYGTNDAGLVTCLQCTKEDVGGNVNP